jgi:hypothetical protein
VIASWLKNGADDGSRSPSQSPGVVGMSFAVIEGVRFTTIGRDKETWVRRAQTYTGLDAADRQALSVWLDYAGARGIDAAVDLSVRPWGIAGAGAIVGVFEAGKEKASWLLLRHSAGWTLARCADGFVSDAMFSLPAVLALIDADRTLAD